MKKKLFFTAEGEENSLKFQYSNLPKKVKCISSELKLLKSKESNKNLQLYVYLVHQKSIK